MVNKRTIAQVLARIPKPAADKLSAPSYTGCNNLCNIMLAVESMKRHTTDEGWQIAAGLESAGYKLCGKRLSIDERNVIKIISLLQPSVVVVQDKREWDVPANNFRDKEARFHNIRELNKHPEIFKLTILKDAHQNIPYHRESAKEMGVHAWIIYYNPQVVLQLAPYLRPEHLVRTYHSLDAKLVPEFSADRAGCLLSGAISGAYPYRTLLIKKWLSRLPEVEYLPHPGYHMEGCATPRYLELLNHFKVAICTSSIYGYALRKIIEATACGCIVITDLPTDEVMPEIDSNLVRIAPNTNPKIVGIILNELYHKYNAERQKELAERAKRFYDYRAVGFRLAYDIEETRRKYAPVSTV